MKDRTTSPVSTKRGAASIFVTIFTIVILGIIVLSFSRLIISEIMRTTNNDLSQSAYDSALAGIEDAKIALLKYHDCLSKGYTGRDTEDRNSCEYIIYHMDKGIANQDCDTVAKALNRVIDENNNAHGVIVQATQKSSDKGSSANMLQAYTCVTVQEKLNDYRSTIDNQNRLRIIPLRSGDVSVDRIAKLKLSWFTHDNLSRISSTGNASYVGENTLPSSQNGTAMSPPLLSAQILQADKQFSLAELSTAANDKSTDRSTVFLKPKSGSSEITTISAEQMALLSDKSENKIAEIDCQSRDTFYCNAEITIPKPFRGGERNAGASFLIVTIPYSAPETDFSIQLLDNAGKTIGFSGVQARIDSTGRANDLYRRIESRVELVDTFFPYPEFAIHMGDGASDLEKLFWVTRDCWTSDQNGRVTTCMNNNKGTSNRDDMANIP